MMQVGLATPISVLWVIYTPTHMVSWYAVYAVPTLYVHVIKTCLHCMCL